VVIASTVPIVLLVDHGWTGTILLLAAYAMLTARRLSAGGWVYQTLNLNGRLALMVNTAYYSAWPSAAFNSRNTDPKPIVLRSGSIRQPFVVVASCGFAGRPSAGRGRAGRENDRGGCGRVRRGVDDVDGTFISWLYVPIVHINHGKRHLMSTASSTRRVALVTGGSGGIGQAVVEKLATNGFSVAVHYAGNRAKADAVVASIVAAGGSALAVGGDVANEDAMQAAFDEVEATFGGVDVVVNTAGIMILAPIATLDLDDLDRMHRTNIRGTFVVSQQAARRVRAGGAIVNFSTTVTRTSFPAYGAYVASKAAVEALTLVLARELRGKDITVNAVAPGPTATALFLDGKDEQTVQNLSKAAPLERLGTPDDIAETVAFLAGPARWVNGQVLFVNGGLA
jgi:3-oxoacyl-[acyl-carrier protein] reductase